MKGVAVATQHDQQISVVLGPTGVMTFQEWESVFAAVRTRGARAKTPTAPARAPVVSDRIMLNHASQSGS
jgi:hypothetical protein